MNNSRLMWIRRTGDLLVSVFFFALLHIISILSSIISLSNAFLFVMSSGFFIYVSVC